MNKAHIAVLLSTFVVVGAMMQSGMLLSSSVGTRKNLVGKLADFDDDGLIAHPTTPTRVPITSSSPPPSPIEFRDHEFRLDVPRKSGAGIFAGRYLLDNRFRFGKFFDKPFPEMLSTVRSMERVTTTNIHSMYDQGSPCTGLGTLSSYKIPSTWMASESIYIPCGYSLRINRVKAYAELEECVMDLEDGSIKLYFETVGELPPKLTHQLTGECIESREEWIQNEKSIERIPFTSLQLRETNIIPGGNQSKHLLVVAKPKVELSISEPILVVFSGVLLPPESESLK